jgi:hypothetical protein
MGCNLPVSKIVQVVAFFRGWGNVHMFVPRAVIFHVALLAMCLCMSCSRLPSYSHPRVAARGGVVPAETIPYRTLEVGDFQAQSLPEDLLNHRQELNAHSTVALRTCPGAHYALSFVSDAGSQVSCARVMDLRFEALMLPGKSWLRPSLETDMTGYVLQHEQVHFAVMELTARRLNQRIFVEGDRLKACEKDAEAAITSVSAKIDTWLAEAEQAALRQHGDFDEATSYRYVPHIQQQWYDRVLRELQNLVVAQTDACRLD